MRHAGILMSLPLLILGCEAPSVTTDDDTDADTDGDTDVGSDYPTAIRFEVVFGDDPVACGQDLLGVGTTQDVARLRDLRFFVSDLVFSGPSGEQGFIPDQDSDWQDGVTGLLDFEDGSAECSESGDARLNDRLTGFIPEGEWDTLTFDLGVPFLDNHKDLPSANPPLNLSSMFWSWQGGHKFVRIDLKNSNNPPDDKWNLHLGSAGCGDGNSLSPPSAPCDRPNLARISIPFDPFAGDRVVMDLEVLFNGVDITTNNAGPVGCMSSPDDTDDCRGVFTALAMGFASGECIDDCAGQVVFSSTRDGE